MRFTATCFCLVVFGFVIPAFAQTPASASARKRSGELRRDHAVAAQGREGGSAASAPAAASALSRWLDAQSVLAARYRWTENSDERVTTSAVQWQAQLRARFLVDKAGRYHVGTFATTGATFRSGWNNTGAGLGAATHPFKVRQLYVGAEPLKGLGFQVGGLAVNRGELGDPIASDNDSFIIGERATVRPPRGPVTQVSFTAAHFDAVTEPDFFKQVGDVDDVNYRQALVGVRINARVAASVDYTYENGRDILREGVTIRVPSSMKLLTQVKIESYQRVDPDHAGGFNTSADIRIRKLTTTLGLMSADRGFGPFNGDRYETGKRYYYTLNYPLTPELVLQFFHTRAFDIAFPIPLKQRVDFVVTYNPKAGRTSARRGSSPTPRTP